MSAFSLKVDIDKPVTEVFGFLANNENARYWYEAVDDIVKLTSGAPRFGTTYRMNRRLPQGRVANEVVITEFEADRLVTFQSRSGPTPFTYRYTFSPSSRGTRLALTGSISGAGLTGASALLAPLAQTLFGRGMASNLQKLKHVLETGQRARLLS